MSEAQGIIASLYLPVSKSQLLLPNVSVAEVVGYQEPTKSPGKPDSFLGLVTWRGINIPLLSYEVANEQEPNARAANARIAVINTIGEKQEQLPFFAVLTQGIPRLVKVNSEIASVKGRKLGPADKDIIKLDGEEAVIPDIEFLEKLAFDNL